MCLYDRDRFRGVALLHVHCCMFIVNIVVSKHATEFKDDYGQQSAWLTSVCSNIMGFMEII